MSYDHALLADYDPGRDHQNWSIGQILNGPEWILQRDGNLQKGQESQCRACFIMGGPVSMQIKFVSHTNRAADCRFTITPRLDGQENILQPFTGNFTYPANQVAHYENINFDGDLPQEVGRVRLDLDLTFTCESLSVDIPDRITVFLYLIKGQPLHPLFQPRRSRLEAQHGTLTGSKKRFDHLFSTISPRTKLHAAQTDEEIHDIIFRLTRSVHSTGGAEPPYFDGDHDQHLTIDGDAHPDTDHDLPVEDSWLAWCRSEEWRPDDGGRAAPHDRYWNDASCIGHAQFIKTMLAAIGIGVRLAWLIPKTRRLPVGANPRDLSLQEQELYVSDAPPPQNAFQPYPFSNLEGGGSITGYAVLIGPGLAWDRYEGCLLTPSGKFLPGKISYASGRTQLPRSFFDNKGFDSARDLLRWWYDREVRGFHRFIAWVAQTDNADYAWDVDGRPCSDSLQTLRDRGRDLPLP